MNTVSFVKYTSYGNNFVIVDETQTPALSEFEKSRFAYQATNIHYGVGSDNFLVIQPCTPEALKAINREHHYWVKPPDAVKADFIFRMFEPDGEEAFCCGNGLMCIAAYLFRRYGIESTRIMTEIPTASPKIISIGTDDKTGTNWANMGHPRRMPATMADPAAVRPHSDIIDTVEDIEITFRTHDLAPFSQERSLKISGYLVFTGEPHMVVFSETGMSVKELQNLFFIRSSRNPSDKPKTSNAEKRVSFGSWLVHHIGTYVNKHYASIFPAGMNINFVRMDTDANAIEYRCFERGIFRETLACGTGALAVSFVNRRLNLLNADRITVWPHRCRWEEPEAQLVVRETTSGWFLYGNPLMLFEGKFLHRQPTVAKKSVGQFKTDADGGETPAAEQIDHHAAVMHY